MIAGLAWIGGLLPGKALIIGLVGAGAMLAGAADAQVTSQSKCQKDGRWYLCKYETETPNSVTTTACASSGSRHACKTERTEKGPPPQPTIEHSDTGVVIMRGGPR